MNEPTPAYRIEHRQGDRVAVLGHADGWSSTLLAPYAARLLADRATGEVVLIEQATGAVVARRDHWPEEQP